MPRPIIKEGYIAVHQEYMTGICNSIDDAANLYEGEGYDSEDMVVFKVIARYKRLNKFEANWP